MTLLQLIDVAGVFADMAASSRDEQRQKQGQRVRGAVRASELRSPELRGKERIIRQRAAAAQAPGQAMSWRGLLGKLWRGAAAADLRQSTGRRHSIMRALCSRDVCRSLTSPTPTRQR